MPLINESHDDFEVSPAKRRKVTDASTVVRDGGSRIFAPYRVGKAQESFQS